MEERVLLQSNCGGFPYLQIRDTAFSLEADCNPQERQTDLRISLTPSGLANQYYGLIPKHLLPCVTLFDVSIKL